MTELLNVLYVQTQGAVLHLDHDTVRIAVEGDTKLRVPLIRLQGIVVFGQVTLTPFLIHRCADDGCELVWMTGYGRFKAQLTGPANGNVLLRRAQYCGMLRSTSFAQPATPPDRLATLENPWRSRNIATCQLRPP